MKISFLRRYHFSAIVSLVLAIALLASPLRAQQPTPPKAAPPQEVATKAEPTFETLLSDDSYKLYGEVRGVGSLLTTGGAGEIVEPILKLANPGPEFNSVVDFLKKNAEALATCRLMFATWPARTDIPSMFVAIEFATPEEAAKFAPKLDKFLPTVMPPLPVPTEEKTEEEAKSPAVQPATEKNETAKPTASPKVIVESKGQAPIAAPDAPKPEPQPRFVLSHSGNLVFISDKSFKIEKLQSKTAGLLAENHNFRVARDRFSNESVFLFFNVALEDRTKPKPSPTVISEEEQARIQREAEAELESKIAEARAKEPNSNSVQVQVELGGQTTSTGTVTRGTLTIMPPSPTPTPTKEEAAQRVASNQIGSMLGLLGQGEPQWPDAIGAALGLNNDEYVVKAILIDGPNAKRLTIPFVPQLISGPAFVADAPSVLPDDIEVFVSASIDFSKTYSEMKKQAEVSARTASKRMPVGAKEQPDGFVEFEKKAGIKFSDDLLPVLGNELAVAASLKTMNSFGAFGIPAPPTTSSADSGNEQEQGKDAPIFLLAIRDRDAARRLMPRVFDGLGIGAANLLAQVERRGDSEIVNYAGVVSYAFIGNFLVLSDSATVRRVADANTNRQTLSSNNVFRTARHWQPRQTLGEVYVSPALMEGYQEQVRKQASTMDNEMRDFLMQLSPKSSAITYALSHDGLGTVHELHLPKNLILAMVAGTSAAMSAMKEGSPEMNEMIAMSVLQMIAGAETTFKSDKGNGSYGSMDQLIAENLVSKEVLDKYGYRFDLTTSGSGFEVTALPIEYGKTGKRSFFVDQTGVVRGDDHGGGPAGRSDKPVQ